MISLFASGGASPWLRHHGRGQHLGQSPFVQNPFLCLCPRVPQAAVSADGNANDGAERHAANASQSHCASACATGWSTCWRAHACAWNERADSGLNLTSLQMFNALSWKADTMDALTGFVECSLVLSHALRNLTPLQMLCPLYFHFSRICFRCCECQIGQGRGVLWHFTYFSVFTARPFTCCAMWATRSLNPCAYCKWGCFLYFLWLQRT